MDALISAAASALAAGDPLRALNCVALREEAPALALRGIALAQLGSLAQARQLLVRAARAFGPAEAVARARCVLAQAEIAFVSRDLGWPQKTLAAALAVLEARGDALNAVHARHLQARRCLLLGRPEEAAAALAGIQAAGLPPARRAAHELILAGMALRRLDTTAARTAFDHALAAAAQARIPALMAEARQAARALELPAACQFTQGAQILLTLPEVEALLRSGALVVDACRRAVRRGNVVVPLATRPVLFSLARGLAAAFPQDVSRATLLKQAFQARSTDDSHRARLRVEMGRLRHLLRPLAEVRATPRGFALAPRQPGPVHLLTWPGEEEHAAVLAFLADGEAWSSSALALALGVSQRTVQRSLDALASAGRVRWFGHARARRWTLTSMPAFTTIMLLPAPLPAA